MRGQGKGKKPERDSRRSLNYRGGGGQLPEGEKAKGGLGATTKNVSEKGKSYWQREDMKNDKIGKKGKTRHPRSQS